MLGKVISPNQLAFVPGHLIQDNILVAHEAFHFLKMQKKGKISDTAVQLDFNKAYNRIQWDFLQALMRQMGFNGDWVMQCMSTVTFSVFVNGAKCTTFKPSRGLCQGDPLSPYLFLWVVEVLLKLLNHRLERKDLSGMKVRRDCPVLSHLMFAGDVLLFLKADVSQCHIVLKILDIYGKTSGQSINFEKSGI